MLPLTHHASRIPDTMSEIVNQSVQKHFLLEKEPTCAKKNNILIARYVRRGKGRQC